MLLEPRACAKPLQNSQPRCSELQGHFRQLGSRRLLASRIASPSCFISQHGCAKRQARGTDGGRKGTQLQGQQQLFNHSLGPLNLG